MLIIKPTSHQNLFSNLPILFEISSNLWFMLLLRSFVRLESSSSLPSTLANLSSTLMDALFSRSSSLKPAPHWPKRVYLLNPLAAYSRLAGGPGTSFIMIASFCAMNAATREQMYYTMSC